MDLTLGVQLSFALMCILFASQTLANSSMMSTAQDIFNTIQTDFEEPDIVSRIIKINEDLGKQYIGGDINVDITRAAKLCQGNDKRCLWTISKDGNVYIPYVFKANFNKWQQQVIIDALMQFNILTCIRFLHRTNQNEYLEFSNGEGCWSYVGPMNGKPQEISLSTSGCVHVGIIQHEVMHALGFQHEHTRTDRDKYIDIIISNIEPGSYGNFKTKHSNNLGVPYDYGSIMHYGKYVFSKGHSLPTILPKPNRTVLIGQIRGLSELDVIKINRLYNCKKCGKLFTRNAGSFTSPNYPAFHSSNVKCKWIIRAPRNQKVLLQFKYFHVQEFLGCSRSHVGIYDGATTNSPIIMGPVCGQIAPAVISKSPTLLFIFLSNGIKESTGFSALYQFVQCGDMILTSESKNGVIEYKSSSKTEEESSCFWLVQSKSLHKVMLNIVIYNFHASFKCSKAYLQIHDVSKAPPENKGKFCGAEPVPVVEGHSLLLEFKHSGRKKASGFKVDYKSQSMKPRGAVSIQQSHCNTFILILCTLLIYLFTI